MWLLTSFTILVGTILVTGQLSSDPTRINIFVATKLERGLRITKLAKNPIQGYTWNQIDGINAREGEISYFRAYDRSYDEWRTWDYSKAKYVYHGGFTKRINVCRHRDSSLITEDDCSRIGPSGLSTEFSLFVADEQKSGTRKIYATVCHDERNAIGYSTLSTKTNFCSHGSRSLKSSQFYAYVGKRFCKPMAMPSGGLGLIDRRTYENGVRVKSVTYRCTYGYNLLGEGTMTCGDNGRWLQRQPTCEAVSCGPPPTIAHGSISPGTPFTYPQRTSYNCNKGYKRHPSNAVIECIGNGRWSGSNMECRPVDCGYPGPLHDGTIDGDFTYGKSVTFKCNNGFARRGPKKSTCQEDALWSKPLPRCKRILCPPLNDIPNSIHHSVTRRLNSDVIILCNTGYIIEGQQTRKCILKNDSTTQAEWSHPPPVCARVTCPAPQSIENGKVFGTEYFYDAEVTYICNTGYSLDGNNRLTCTMNNWDGEPPTCQAITCRDPGVPRNGRRSGDHLTYGSTMQYECDVGYTMLGQATIICGEGRIWSAAKPACEAIQCPPIGSPAHGSVELSSGEYGSSAIYSCFPGYQMTGGRESRCMTSGQWSGGIPDCGACLIGYYKEGSNNAQCMQCPPNSNTSSQASFSQLHCICATNSQGPYGGPCAVVQCESLSAPVHGQILSCGNNYRDICSFECDPGYILTGYRSRTCTKNGWTGNPAACSACPPNTYKHMLGSSTCIPCPRQTTTKESLGLSIESCTCATGYHGPPGGPCLDVNECETDNGGCSQTCLNSPGGFRCRCSIPGYNLRHDNKTCYQNQTCSQLEQNVGNGTTRCRYAEQENGYICHINCKPSFFFVSGINNYITCGSDSGFEWSHQLVNKTAKIPACTREFFVDMSLPIWFKYRSEQSCNELPIHMGELQTQIVDTVTNLNACGSFCSVRDFNATYSEIVGESGGCEATVMMDIFIKNPDENAVAAECDPVCKRLNMREMLSKTFAMKNNVSYLVQNTPGDLVVSGTRALVGTRALTSSFGYGRPQMLCDPGKVLSKNRLCVPCDSGFYLPDRSLESCLPCPKGTYQIHGGQVGCVPCNTLTTTITQGSDHPAMCSVRIEEVAVNGNATVSESDGAAAGDAQGSLDPVL